MQKKVSVKMFSVRPHIFASVKKFLRLLQNRVQATHLFLQGDDLGWGAPGLSDDLHWGGVAKPPVMPRGVEVGPHPWDCLRGILVTLSDSSPISNSQ